MVRSQNIFRNSLNRNRILLNHEKIYHNNVLFTFFKKVIDIQMSKVQTCCSHS